MPHPVPAPHTLASRARSAVAALFWRVARYRLVVEPYPEPPAVIVAAPHTSNWDFAFFVAILWSERLEVRFLAKHTLFRGVVGSVLRALGGIPVDRRDPAGLVDDLVRRFQSGERFYLVITPEGTRGATTGWKSGFYRIARDTGLPCMTGYVDSATRTSGIGPTIDLTGDVRADMDRFRAFFGPKKGLKPQLTSMPRLAAEEEPPAA